MQITYLRDCEKEGTELSSMADPSAMWPSDVAASLFELGRCCSNYDSHARPVASEVGTSCTFCVLSLIPHFL